MSYLTPTVEPTKSETFRNTGSLSDLVGSTVGVRYDISLKHLGTLDRFPAYEYTRTCNTASICFPAREDGTPAECRMPGCYMYWKSAHRGDGHWRILREIRGVPLSRLSERM